MNLRTIVLSAAALVAAQGALSAQAEFIPMPSYISQVTDITPDGTIIVGNGSDPSGNNSGGFYWDWQTSPAPTFIGGNSAVAVSDDGQYIAGNIDDPVAGAQVAARWEPTTGWVSLGYLPNALSCPSKSSAYDISGDGSTVVGLSWDGCSARAFIWDAVSGMQQLEVLGNGGNRASVIARDKSNTAGFAQGSFSRTPTLWDPSNPPAGGTAFDLNVGGECEGISDDGSIVTGSWDGEAFYYSAATGVVTFGSLNSGWSGSGTGVSNNGRRICGTDTLGLAAEAWVWEETTGIVSLQTRMAQLGVLGVPSLGFCNTMTPDGQYIVGATTFQGAWIVRLPRIYQYGQGCLGSSGAPSLSGNGSTAPGGLLSLSIENGVPSTFALMFLNVTPFTLQASGCSVLAPLVDFSLPLNGNGDLQLSTQLPLNTPPGTLHLQAVTPDPNAQNGQFAVTNKIEMMIGS